MKKLMMVALLLLSVGTIDCKRAPETTEEKPAPWYLSYKNGALIGALSQATYDCVTFDINSPEFQALPAEQLQQIEELGDGIYPSIAIIGGIVGAIRGLIAVGILNGGNYLFFPSEEDAPVAKQKIKAAL